MSSVMKGIQDLQIMGKTFFSDKDRLMSSVMKGIQVFPSDHWVRHQSVFSAKDRCLISDEGNTGPSDHG